MKSGLNSLNLYEFTCQAQGKLLRKEMLPSQNE